MVKEIGEKIKQLRNANNVTQEQLSEDLGISVQQLHKYETGKNRINIEKLLIVAKKFNVDLNFFSDDSDQPSYLEQILPADEQEIVDIYRNIRSGKFRDSWKVIGKELTKLK